MDSPVFLTYNHESEIGERTALRLQTISNLYGAAIQLPYRSNSQVITYETKTRIQKSPYLLALCLETISYELRAEIQFALQVKVPIVMIYWHGHKPQFAFSKQCNVTEVYLSLEDVSDAQRKINQFLQNQESASAVRNFRLGLAIVFVGLTLLILWKLSEIEN